MASSDALLFPKRATAYRVVFPILDADGDFVTGATGLDSEISKDQGTFVDCTSEATEIATSSGIYYLDLSATEMTADCVAVIVKTTTAGAKTTPLIMYPADVGDIPVNVTAWLGTAPATPGTAGVPSVDAIRWATQLIPTPTVTGVPKSDTTTWNGTAVATPNTVGYPVVTIKDGVGVGEIDTTSGGVLVAAIAANAINAAAIATDAITAAKIATDAIGASELAGDAATEIRSLASGTSDSGTTTTMVDAARTEADTDYWLGQILVFTSGNLLGQSRLITGFNAATDTITFSPATTQAVATQNYEIWPNSNMILAQLTHTNAVVPSVTTVTGNVNGSVGSVVGAVGSVTGNVGGNVVGSVGSVTGAVGSVTGNVGGNVVGSVGSVTGAVGSVTGNVGGNVTGSVGSVASGGIAAASFAAGAIDANAIATDAIGSAELAASAATEIATAVLDQAVVEPTGVFAWPASLRTIIQFVGALSRNKRIQTTTTQTVRNDADSATIATSATSDASGTTTRGEWA